MMMIERIAMSIHDSLAHGTDVGEPTAWHTLTDDLRSPYRVAAVKVLGAMRGPTHQMLADGNLHGSPADAANVWERMIFRALYEQDE